MRDADRATAGRRRAPLQQVPRHVAVLADPAGPDDRSQPPLRGHGGDQRDVDAGARLPRLPAGERRHDRADPQRQRLLHGGGRQVAPDPAGGGQPVGAVPAVADGRGLRLLLRLHGRGDEPLVPAALPGPLRRRAGPVARGRLPPVRGPRRQRHLLGREPAGDHPRAALLHLPGARRDARAVPRRGRVARQVRRPVRRRLGRAAGPDAGPSEGARHRAGVRRAGPLGRGRAALGRARRDRAARRRAVHGDLRRVRRARRRAGRPVRRRPGGDGRPRRHADLLPARRQRGLRRGRPARHLPRAPGRARHPGRHRRHGRPAGHARRPDDVRHLSGRLGAGDEHAVPVDQAARAPRRHPRRHDRALGQRDRGPRRDPPPVAPRHRRAAHHPRGRGARGPRVVRRRGAAAGRGHQPGLQLRRRRRSGPAQHAVLRDDRQPRRLPRRLDRRDPPRRPLGDGGHPEAALRRGRLGALRPRATTGARRTTWPRRSPSGCGSSRTSSSARPRGTRCSPSTTG